MIRNIGIIAIAFAANLGCLPPTQAPRPDDDNNGLEIACQPHDPRYMTCDDYRPDFNRGCEDFASACVAEGGFCPSGLNPVARSWTTPVLSNCYPSTIPACYRDWGWIETVIDCCAPAPIDATCTSDADCPQMPGQCAGSYCSFYDDDDLNDGIGKCFLKPLSNADHSPVSCDAGDGSLCVRGVCY